MTDDTATRHRDGLTSIIRKYFLIALAVWTAVIAVIFVLDTRETRRFVLKEAHSDALANYNKDVSFREWATTHGGVYVPVDKTTLPNPYLTNVKERDLLTPSGRQLTLMNPAYMARQMNEFFAQKGTVFGHITSLRLKNPINKPDKWEEDALMAFERGEKERIEVAEIAGKPFLRLMRPMTTKEGCLKCHADQGYQVGDIRGGVSVSVGLEPYYAEARVLMREHAAAFGLVWLLGSVGLLTGYGYARRLARARDEARDAVLDSEGRFRQLSEAAFEGVAIHADGIILDCNAAYAAMMGYEPSDIKGIPVLATVAPEFHEEIRRRMGQGYTEPFEALAVKKDGTRFYVEAFGKSIVYKGKDARISVIHDLSRRKKAEEALRKNEALLNQTQQISHVGGWEFDVPSGTMHFTREAYNIHEVGPDFDPNDINTNIKFYAPADQAIIENAFKRAVAFGEPYDLELMFTGAKGTRKWVRTSAQVEWMNGKVARVFGNIIDISERRAAADRLEEAKVKAEIALEAARESEDRITLLLNSMGEAVYGIDLDGNCTFYNQSCLRILGYKDGDRLLGKNMHDLIHHSRNDGTLYPVKECKIYKAFREGVGTHVDDEVLWRADGTCFPSEYRSFPIWRDGKITGSVVTFTDITELKQAETELAAAKEAAEEASRLKSEFLSNMTHELNTPLTSVLGYSRLANERDRELAAALARLGEIMDRPDDAEVAAWLAEARLRIKSAIEAIQEITKYNSIVIEQGQRLFNLLNDLMDLSRLESGQIKAAEQSISTFMLLTTMERYYKDAAMMKGLAFADNAADFRPNDLLFTGDRKWLEKALGNLVQNAIKFSVAGKIRVTASKEGANVFFRVKDEGVGIRDRDRERLFESFRQLDGSSTRAHGGVGLGLAFSRKLVQAMGGDISVQSEAGKGSEFTITIPYRPSGSNPG